MKDKIENLSASLKKKIKDLKFNKLPDKIKELVKDLFADEEILIVSESDLDLTAIMHKNYLIVTDKHLAVFSFNPDYLKSKKKIRYNSLQLESIEEIKIELSDNIAFLSFTVHNKNQQILCFPQSEIYRFEKVAKKIVKIISKENSEIRLFKVF
ncbi:hypothetical protein [Natronospora cellulosivora (SeqCode)]